MGISCLAPPGRSMPHRANSSLMQREDARPEERTNHYQPKEIQNSRERMSNISNWRIEAWRKVRWIEAKLRSKLRSKMTATPPMLRTIRNAPQQQKGCKQMGVYMLQGIRETAHLSLGPRKLPLAVVLIFLCQDQTNGRRMSNIAGLPGFASKDFGTSDQSTPTDPKGTAETTSSVQTPPNLRFRIITEKNSPSGGSLRLPTGQDMTPDPPLVPA